MAELEPGGGESISPPFALDPKRGFATADMARLSIRRALGRNLPTVRFCAPHGRRMSIVGGGPSVEDTCGEIGGYVAAVNKAHDWLLDKGARVHACGLLDPVPWLASYITPHPEVRYFVASLCHPLVFDKLEGHRVTLWHAAQGAAIPMDDLLPPGALQIPGGTSMALRWIDLGYVLGFRAFDMHGFDCSHRGERHHVYEFHQDDGIPVEHIMGYATNALLLAQVNDFFLRTAFLAQDETYDPIEIRLHGDGLMQHMLKTRTGSTVFRSKGAAHE